MYGKVASACVMGIDGVLVEVETDISNGLPFFQVVGLPDSAVREATERVKAALKNCGFGFPMERITVNLAPADVRKEGSAFDLAIAAGILTASGQLKPEDTQDSLWIGELALDGGLRPVPGVLSMVHQALKQGIRKVVVPVQNEKEAMLVQGAEIRTLRSIRELQVKGAAVGLPAKGDEVGAEAKVRDCDGVKKAELQVGDHKSDEQHQGVSVVEDYSDVCGQFQAKRALMIAAAGMHNLLFIGPPGTGKTMLVKRLPTILPDMSDEEALEVTKIYSVSGKLSDRGQLIRHRPFRAPHHTISQGGLIGGGSIPKPGEVSLAHRGVLFLDELPEFGRHVLEVLRQPLEDRKVTIGRARAVYTFPAQFMLAASMNPCPCGYYGSDSVTASCTCSALRIKQYRAKISGPLLDRIDIHVEVPRTPYLELAQKDGSEPLSSSAMRGMVLEARSRQLQRYMGTPFRSNAELSGRALREYCRPTPEAAGLLAGTFEALGLSVRAHDRILKLARTIADLDGAEIIDTVHVAEAIQYRCLDKIGNPLA